MKRVGHLFEMVCGLDNIRLSVVEAAKGKESRAAVRACLDSVDATAESVASLLAGGFVPSEPRMKRMYDNRRRKWRTIACPAFYPDQIVHHALMRVLQPVLDRTMYEHVYGSLKGRGSHQAVARLERWVRCAKRPKYCLEADFHHCYETIPHSLVMEGLERRVKDARLVSLVEAVVGGYSPGLPIGYFPSAGLSHLALDGFDRLVVQSLRPDRYLRYADNVWAFSNNKRSLHRAFDAMAGWAADRGMSFNGDWQVFPLAARPVSALGFEIYPDRCVLKPDKFLRTARYARLMAKRGVTEGRARSMLSRLGDMSHTDCGIMQQRHITPYVNVSYLKEVVSDADRVYAGTHRV